MSEQSIPISVLMAVYNTKREYLTEAIESILNQTFNDFEFIIVDDGSDDECRNIIKGYRDSRIVLITNPCNYGLTKSLNIGLKHVRGKYIARMDADDISYPDRLECQFKYMEKHEEIDVLGAWVKEGKRVKKACGAVTSEWRHARMLFDNVGIYHPTAFMRTSFLKNNEFYYDEEIKKAQDFELWTRCLEKGKMYVFPKVLLDYRIHAMQISKKNLDEQNHFNTLIRERLLKRLALSLSERELQQFKDINHVKLEAAEVEELFNKIVKANYNSKTFGQTILKYELTTKWILYILQSKGEQRKSFLKKQYLYKIIDIRYYFYMLHIALCKQDIWHCNREIK